MRLQLKRRARILKDLVVRTVTGSDLTDITDVAQVKGVLGAVAEELSAFYFEVARLTDIWNPGRAANEDLDERAKDFFPRSQFRLGPRSSVGTVVLYRNVPGGGTVTAPAGSAIGRTTSGALIRTIEQAVASNTSPAQITGHAAGQDSNPVAAVAISPGERGNFASSALIGLTSRPPGFDNIAAVTAFVGGRDKESDPDFRQRLRSYVDGLSRSPADAILAKVLGLSYTDPTTQLTKTVRSASVLDDPFAPGSLLVYIDDGFGTPATSQAANNEAVTGSALGGEEFLPLAQGPVWLEQGLTVISNFRGTLAETSDFLLHPTKPQLFFSPPLVITETITASYTAFTGLIALVQKTVDGLVADRVNFPGYRAGGILARVLPPKVIVPKVAGVIATAPGTSSADRAAILARAVSDVSAYINQLGLSGDVVRNTIIERIIDAGAYDVALTDPPANIVVKDDEIPHITDADIALT